MFTSVAEAMAPAQQGGAPPTAMESMMQFVPLILIFVIFYFLLIRPQQKKAKEHKDMLSAVKKGDKVTTMGGIHGVVDSVSDNTVTLKIAENVKIRLDRGAIAAIRTGGDD